MEKLISIIIPAYNAEEYIVRSVEALLNQEYRNIEVIVVIDGATDGTLEKCKEIAKNDNRLKYIYQENKGVMGARFNGIEHAKGDYIMFSDADDYVKPNAVSELIKLIQKYNADIIKYRYIRIPKNVEQEKYSKYDEKIILKNTDSEKNIYDLFLEGYQLHSINNEIVKRELFTKINIDKKQRLSFGEDFLLNIELFSNAEKIVLSNKVLYNYVAVPTSLTRTSDISRIMGNIEACINVYSKLHEYLEKWKINSNENIKKVDIRILFETASLLFKLQQTPYNKKELEDLLKANKMKEKIHNLRKEEIEKNTKYYNQMTEILDMI